MPNIIIRLKDKQSFEQCCKQLCDKKIVHRKLNLLNAVSLYIEESAQLEQMIGHQNIEQISEDITIRLINQEILKKKELKQNLQNVSTPWGMTRIGAVYRYIPRKYYRPSIAILDSGLSLHPALKISKSFVNFSTEKSAQDLNGHGTHIAGTIGGFYPKRTREKDVFHGIYPRIRLISVKAFGKDGSAPLSAIIQGIEWCINKKVKVINMSFGLNEHHPLLHEAVQLADKQGIIMVASSGNDGKPGLQYPARYPEVISVGSINRDSQISSFSQYGTNLDLVAPGEDILSTWINKSYTTISGTSMSCAHVTGAISIILALQPDLPANQVKKILLEHTLKLPTSYFLQGNGLVSVKSIIASLKK